MTATSAIELVAAPAPEPARAGHATPTSYDHGETFDEVLFEQTSAAGGETRDGDEPARSIPPSKRSRATSDAKTAPVAAQRLRVVAKNEGTVVPPESPHPTDDSEDSNLAGPPRNAPEAPTDDLVQSWRGASEVDAVEGDQDERTSTGPAMSTTDERSAIQPVPLVSSFTARVAPAPTLPAPRPAATSDTSESAANVEDSTPAVVVGVGAARLSSPLEKPAVSASEVDDPTRSGPKVASAVVASSTSAAAATAGSEVARANAPRSSSLDTAVSTERHSSPASVTVDPKSELSAFSPLSAPTRALGPTASNPAGPSSESTPSSLDVADLASLISHAVLGADGSYTLSVAMHPSELGHVQAVVSLSGEDLRIAIAPQTAVGHAALSNALQSLKSELSRSGLNVDVSLRDPESRSQRGSEEPSRAPSAEVDAETEDSSAPAPEGSVATSQIHLIL